MTNIKILSLDQSTTATGWCLFDDDKYLRHGLIDLKRDKNGSSQRMQIMQTLIQDVISSCQPNIVVLEDTVLQRNPQTLKDLAQLQGVIMGICKGLNITCKILFPTTWRKELNFTQGKGVKRPDLKKQAKDYVYNSYRFRASEDECDAICIGLAYSKIEKEKE